MTKENVVIVGGGIAGLLSAALLQKVFKNVYLLEANNEVGGLLRSTYNEHGDAFDMGTHIPSNTTTSEIDELLFQMNKEQWNIFPKIAVANFFAGGMNNHTCIDARSLDSSVYKQGVHDMLHNEFCGDVENAKDYFLQNFGMTFLQEIFEPIAQKLYGCSCENLHRDAYTFFGLQRIIAFNDVLTKELKKSPFFDRNISFHNEDDAPSNYLFYYPKEGGIGKWVASIVEQLSGVNILTSESVKSVEWCKESKNITSLCTTSGKEIACDFLVWSAPLFFLTKACGISVDLSRPLFRKSVILNFTFDKPFISKAHYIVCYDKNYRTFRVTLYPNVRQDSSAKRNTCSVEVFTDIKAEIDANALQQEIVRELREMNIIDDHQILYYQCDTLGGHFPVFTNSFVENSLKLCEVVQQNFTNVMVVGKSTGKHFLMNSVLHDVYEQIHNRFRL